MKSDQTIILERLIWTKELAWRVTSSSRAKKQKSEDFITSILGIKDPNITISDYVEAGTHKEVIAKLDYSALKNKDKIINVLEHLIQMTN